MTARTSDRTKREMDILASFRAMDEETQQEAIGMFRNLARAFPCAPMLRLVHSDDTKVVRGHQASNS